MGFPSGSVVKKPSAMQERLGYAGYEFNPWVGNIPWRRTLQPTPVFLPRESHGHRSLAGYHSGISLIDHKISNKFC